MADASISTFEPTEITAGSTLKWVKSLLDYPASEGYVLKYYFRGAGTGFDATATADGDDFEVNVPTATTAQMAAGTYYWQAEVSLSGEKFIVDTGEVKVKASLAATAAGDAFDGRSEAKKILDAIDAMLKGKATLDQQEYSIGNRALKRIPIPDLLSLRKHYAQLVARERRVAKGAPLLKSINARFKRP
ncbi:MAG TPA: hypothetical protein VN256_08150 [Pyrinomonadaceae bacterium]|nr:hypothetical protein [Pyrinomonadaceae bacterium]